MSELSAPAAVAALPPRWSPRRSLADFYRPEPALPLRERSDEARRILMHWRWRMFAGFFFGYAILYFCRKNISAALPVMATDLGYANVQLGLIGTALYVTYGLGKFLNGIMADRANIRRFMATGLIISGLLNLLFSSVGTIWLLAIVWGLNGWFQSMGFPPIARGMTLWYPAKGKATRWAFWTCSHQAGTAMIMALSAWLLSWGTWRTVFYVPAVLSIVTGIVLLFVLGDTPESKGFASQEAFENGKAGDQESYRALFFRYVLGNRTAWVVGLIDLFVYVIRYGTLDWTAKFLVETKGYTPVEAAFRAGVMPLFGVVGVLASGFIADVVFKARYRAVNALSLVFLIAAMVGFDQLGPGHRWLDLAFLAAIGFFIEGPQSILGGVGAVDAGGSAKVASAAAGLVGILAYVGASLSGVGTGYAIDRFGWSGAFSFWIACALIGLFLCVFVWREKQAA
ncbi:MAG: MFS transporter [Myxococcota bacterium]